MNGVYVVSALDRLHNQSQGLKLSNGSKYFSDVGQNNFKPMDNSKRGDFILMLVKTVGLQAGFSSNFNDVPVNSYYYNAIGTVRALGITSGTGNGNFDPKSGITRQDLLVQVYKVARAAGIPLQSADKSELSGFSDSSQISSYAAEAMAAMVRNGIISAPATGSIQEPRPQEPKFP